MGLSGDGQTGVGAATATSAPQGPQYPFRWTASEGTVELGTSEGGANGASYDGSRIVGWIGNAPFLWTAESGMQDLGLPYGLAWDVSSDGGVVVGESSLVAGRAFRWTPATGALALLSGSPFVIGSARAVSADGTTVVGGVGDESGEDVPAYRWTAAEGLVVLGPLPGCDGASTATAVSGDGRLIAGECWLSDGITRKPFVWTDGTGLLSLDAFLALRGVPAPRSLVAPEITAVSDDGRVIAIVDVLPDATLSYLVDVTPAVPALALWLHAALAASLAGIARARLVEPGAAGLGARA